MRIFHNSSRTESVGILHRQAFTTPSPVISHPSPGYSPLGAFIRSLFPGFGGHSVQTLRSEVAEWSLFWFHANSKDADVFIRIFRPPATHSGSTFDCSDTFLSIFRLFRSFS